MEERKGRLPSRPTRLLYLTTMFTWLTPCIRIPPTPTAEGSIDGNQRLVIRGKYVPKYIESLLRKYITEYVTCKMCRSASTQLTKDTVSRLFFCHCKGCGSSRSVAPIRSGYHAATRADRRAAKKAQV